MAQYQAIVKQEFDKTPACYYCDMCEDGWCRIADKDVSKYFDNDYMGTAPKECPMEEVI